MSDEVRMDVLWVHWYMIDETHRAGWKAKWLYWVKPIPSLEDGAFSFLTLLTLSADPTSSPVSPLGTSHLLPVIPQVYGTLRESVT